MPNPNEFDPMAELSPEDEAYLDRQRRAMQRQSEAWANRPGQDPHDVGRAEAAEEHRRATMEQAGVTPAEMSKRLAEGPPEIPPDVVASITGTPAGAQPAPTGVPMKLTIYRASPVVGEHDIPPKGEQFAPDWKTLKGLVSSHDGTWSVEHYELPVDVSVVLGFFGKVGWAIAPEDLEALRKAQFSAIVKGGMVFRADPDE